MTVETLISVDRKIVISDGIEAANLDGETVLLDINSGHYFGLNEVGSRIVELVKDATTIRQVLDQMLSEYDVDPQRLEQDVASFIQQMIDRRLIKEMDGTPE